MAATVDPRPFLDAILDAGATPALLAVTGSHAHGLAHSGSDIDLRGMHVVDTRAHLGLDPVGRRCEMTSPLDATSYEVGHLVHLAVASSPNLFELLWADEYLVMTEDGEELVAMRDAFTSEEARAAYVGFTIKQTREIERGIDKHRDPDKLAKWTRHALRTVRAGHQLITTGRLDVAVTYPDELAAFMASPIRDQLSQLRDETQNLRQAPGVVAAAPDKAAANAYLLRVRERNWDRTPRPVATKSSPSQR